MKIFNVLSKLSAIICILCLPFNAISQAITSFNTSPYFTGPVGGAYESNLTVSVKGSQTGTVYYVTYKDRPNPEPHGSSIESYATGGTTPPSTMVAQNSITVSNTTDAFSSNITNLLPHVTYYTYAVLENSSGVKSEVEERIVHLMKAKKGSYYFYTEYLPVDHDENEEYALLIFLHGNNESGSTIGSLQDVIVNGPPKEITYGIDSDNLAPSDTLLAKEFIIISPQSPTNSSAGGWSVSQLDTFIDSLKVEYPEVDANRIYLTGLSMGGFGTWAYAKTHYAKLAAIVPISGGGSTTNACNLQSTPIWAFHDDPDNIASASGTKNFYAAVKACAVGASLPVKVNMTLIKNKGIGCTTAPKHSVWHTAYNPSSKKPFADFSCDTKPGRDVDEISHNTVDTGDNVYSWLLKHSLNAASPVANAGPDVTLYLPTNSVTLNGSGAGTGIAYLWTKVSGPSVTMTNTTTEDVSLSNMVLGTYVFRLRVTDSNGTTATDDTEVRVLSIQANKTYKVNFRSSTTSPAPGTEWNEMTAIGTGATVANLKSTDGATSSYTISFTDGFNGSNASGSTSTSGVYPVEVMSTSFFVTDPGIAVVKLSGLNDAKKYTLKFFGSREETTGTNRTTEYIVGSTTATLNASNNSINTANIPNLTPTSGEIIFTVRGQAGGEPYGYLNALEFVESDPQVGKTLKLDFRPVSAPPAPGTEWNDITGQGTGANVANLKYTDGANSNYTFTVLEGFNGNNVSGEDSPSGIYPAAVMKSAWFVTNPTAAEVQLSGLDDNKKYTLKFFGSRKETTSTDRTTAYTVGSSTMPLNASNNSTLTADIADITPTNGIITFTVADAAGGQQYGYLNAMEVVESIVVEETTTLKLNFRPGNGTPSPGTEWNDITVFSTGATKPNLKYSNGAATNYLLTVASAFIGSNSSGSQSTTGVYPAEVMQTAWYVTNSSSASVKISGLDNSKLYTFRFFGSRDETTLKDRYTDYTIGSETASLNASQNSSTVETISDVSPTSGEITFTVTDAADGEPFGYLNAVVIIESEGGGSFAMMSEEMSQTSDRNAFTIHPMPYTNRVTVTFGEKIEGKVAITLKDISGRTYFHKNNLQVVEGTVVEIDLTASNIPRGMGVLKVQSSKGYSKTVQVYRE